jgi:hypothetical protein
MKLLIALVTLLAMLAFLSSSNADYWSSYVSTNTSTWSIYRQSDNVSFNLSSSIEGNVAPIEIRGRIVEPVQSYYAEVEENDVRLSQRTSAQEGYYKSDEIIRLRSRNVETVDISYSKPSGTDVYTFSFEEFWPVSLISSRTLEYSGRRINNRDIEINNKDFVGSNILYSTNLSMDRKTVMWLNRLNATVLATDDAILLAEFLPQKYLGYLTNMHTTGIMDLTYKQISSQFDAKRRNYPAIGEGTERYYGTYDLARRIEIRSIFEKTNDTGGEEYSGYSWLPCCNDGWNDMEHSYQKNFGTKTSGVFDCTCYNGTMKA